MAQQHGAQCGQRRLRRERQRGQHGRRRQRAVIRPIRHAARGVTEQVALLVGHPLHLVGGAVAGGQAPAVAVVADELVRVEFRVAALHLHRAAAVLEIVRSLLAHERVAHVAQVQPRLRVVVHEQRAGVEEVLVVEVLPLVGRGPAGVAVGRNRMGGRAQRQRVQHDRLAVALPAVVQVAALRFPALVDGARVVLRPAPVDAPVQRLRQLAQLGFVGIGAVERGGNGEHAGDQQRAVDHRQLRLPHPRAAVDVEEVVIEALVAGSRGAAALVAVAEEAQRQQAAAHRLGALDPAARDRRRIARQREAHHRDAHRRVGARGIRDQPVARVHRLHEIAEGRALQAVEHGVIGERTQRGHRSILAATGETADRRPVCGGECARDV